MNYRDFKQLCVGGMLMFGCVLSLLGAIMIHPLACGLAVLSWIGALILDAVLDG